ncbi:hypothetical protein NQ314_020944 [Rhamnusium bicolor]|uniref:Uncharacterized protein n=1 Tax=Rhamnusium bicolor TaxID=1586634 RepID=A0AAV8WIR1_9CUCU|nr:hypothetical protein NQ314_020944 [Rhamnusium bicolor]
MLDTLKIFSDNVDVTRNSYHVNEVSSRTDDSLESGVEEFIKSHNIKFNLPIVGFVTIDARSLDKEEIDLKLNFNSGGAAEAITLVPFALGILGLKAWNGLQLAFFSFIISTGLAIFQLCQKLAADSAHAHIAAAPGPWETLAANQYAARSFGDAQQMAYSAYTQL